jgi:hypothetical protein
MVITPTFDATLTPAEISVINTAIAFYESTFTNPITVRIRFAKTTNGLGLSSPALSIIPYETFITALRGSASSADDALAFSDGRLPVSTTNPVNGLTTIGINIANIHALGISGFPDSGGFDGVVSLNTSIMDVNGGPFSMISTVEHEIDEVLGLGSGLPRIGPPLPEDLFRYGADPNVRNFTINLSCNTAPHAYLSIDGTTHLNEFNNCNGDDYGDWVSHTPSQVQDAVTNGTGAPFLTLASTETRALDIIGYSIVPQKKVHGQITSN